MKCYNNHEEIEFDDNIDCPLCKLAHEHTELQYKINDYESELSQLNSLVEDLKNKLWHSNYQLNMKESELDRLKNKIDDDGFRRRVGLPIW